MTIEIVRYGDTVGHGFARERGEDTTALPFLWAFSGGLIAEQDLQPPPFPELANHPIWTLWQVTIQGRPWWCFLVQGRGVGFGPAGGCHLGFSPISVTPAEVWRLGRRLVAGQPDQPVPDRTAVCELLAGVLLTYRSLRLPGQPAETAAIIETALLAVPPAEVRRRVWSTCALNLQAGPNGTMPIVTGEWPEELRRNDPRTFQRVQRQLPPTAALDELARAGRTVDQKLVEAIAADALAGGSAVAAMAAGAPDMRSLLRQWHDARADLTPAEVWHRIDGSGPDSRASLAGRRLPIESAVIDDRVRALEFVRPPDRAADPVAELMLARLVELQVEKPATDVLGLSTIDDAGVEWMERLRTHFDRHCEVNRTTLSKVLKKLASGKGPLASPGALGRAWPLWRGLNPSALSREPTNVATAMVALDLNRGALTEMTDVAFGLGDPLVIATRAARGRTLTVETAADLVVRSCRGPIVSQSMPAVRDLIMAAAQAAARQRDRVAWLDRFRELTTAHDSTLAELVRQTTSELLYAWGEHQPQTTAPRDRGQPVIVPARPPAIPQLDAEPERKGRRSADPRIDTARGTDRLDERTLHGSVMVLASVAVVLCVVAIAWALGNGLRDDYSQLVGPPAPTNLADTWPGAGSSEPTTQPGSPIVALPAEVQVVAIRLEADELATIREDFATLVRQQVGQRAVEHIVITYVDGDLGRAGQQVQTLRDRIWAAWARDNNVQIQLATKQLPPGEKSPYAEIELHLKP